MKLLLCFTVMGQLNAQTIRPNRISLSNALSRQDAGYTLRSNDERYEGFYNKEKGEEDFRVFSLLKGKLDYVMSADESLTILTKKLPGIDSVYIAGISFNFYPAYRLDARLKSGDETHVPLSAAIKVKNLFQDHLGIYGYTGNIGAPEFYVPVEVRSSINKKNETGYNLTLTSIKSVADVTWDYLLPVKDLSPDPIQGNGTIAYVPAKSPIIIPLAFNKTVTPGSIVIVQVWGRIAGHKEKERLQKLKIIVPKS